MRDEDDEKLANGKKRERLGGLAGSRWAKPNERTNEVVVEVVVVVVVVVVEVVVRRDWW